MRRVIGIAFPGSALRACRSWTDRIVVCPPLTLITVAASRVMRVDASEFKPAATACGDPTDDDCSNADHCSGTDASCLDDDEPTTTTCGDADAECSAASAFADYYADDGGAEARHFHEVDGDCVGDAALLRA